MARPVDLPQIRRALARLDQIAVEHPEYCQQQGQWTAQEVENIIMAKPVSERMRAYRARLREQGRTRISVFLTPAAHAALTALRGQHPDTNINDLVSGILTGQISTQQEHRP